MLEAARTAGLDVPGDLSVVGFDDVEVSGYAGLTTVRQPLFESGRLAAELLLESLAAEEPLGESDAPPRPRARGAVDDRTAAHPQTPPGEVPGTIDPLLQPTSTTIIPEGKTHEHDSDTRGGGRHSPAVLVLTLAASACADDDDDDAATDRATAARAATSRARR